MLAWSECDCERLAGLRGELDGARLRVPEWAVDSSEVDEDVSRQPVQRWECSVGEGGGGRGEFVGVSRGQRRPRWRWMDR